MALSLAISPRREPSRASLLPPPESPNSALASARASNYGSSSSRSEAAPVGPLFSRSLFAGSDVATQRDSLDIQSYTERSGLLKGPYADILRGEINKTAAEKRAPWRRCWITTAVVSSLVFTAIMLTIVYTVIAPVYVQSRIDATTLVFSGLNISQPLGLGGAAGGASFTIAVRAVLSNLAPVDGTLNAFDATLNYGGAAVATFKMPTLSARAGVDNVLVFSAPVAVVSEAAFTAFGTALVQRASVDMTLSGRLSVTTSVGAVALTIENVNFAKTVSVPGCAGLRGGVVTAFSLAGSTPSQAIVALTVSVPNPSIVRIDPLGDLAAVVTYRGAYMGTVYARDAVLAPGTASISLSGALVNSNTAVTNELISSYLGGVPVLVSAETASCVGDPRCPGAVPLFAPLLDSGAVELSAVLNGSPVPLVGGVDVQGMFLEPLGAEQVTVNLNVTVLVSALLGLNSPLAVTSLALNCTLEGQGTALGSLAVPYTPVYAPATRGRRLLAGGDSGALATLAWAEGEGAYALSPLQRAQPRVTSVAAAVMSSTPVLGSGPPLLNVSLSLAAVLTLGESDVAFSAFVLDFLSAQSVTIGLVSGEPVIAGGSGNSSFVVGIACVLGNLTVKVPLEARTTVKGIAGFPLVQVRDFTVLDTAPPGAIAAELSVALLNPSPATFPLGANTTMGIFFAGERVGTAAVYNGLLRPGFTVLSTVGLIEPSPGAPLSAAARLFSAYLAGANSTITVKGETVDVGPDRVTPQWLVNAVQNLSLVAVLPGLPAETARSLMTNATVVSLGLDLVDPAAPVGPPAPPFLAKPIVSGTVRAVLQLPFTLPVDSFGAVNLSLAFVEVGGGPMAFLNLTNQRAQWAPCSSVPECDKKFPVSPAQRAAEALHAAMPAAVPLALALRDDPPMMLYPAGVLEMTLDPSPLTIINVPAFARLMTSVLQQATATVRLLGSASPLGVGLPFGTVPLSGVIIDTTVVLRGIANLSAVPPVVSPGVIYNTTSSSLDLTVSVNVTNDSTLRGHLGPVAFGIAYGTRSLDWDYPFGPTVITRLPALTLVPGNNSFVALGVLKVPSIDTSPNANLYTRTLVSRFLSGFDTAVDLVGLTGGAEGVSSDSPLLQPAASGLTTKATFPGSTAQLIVNGTLYVDKGVLRLRNTLPINLRLDQANLTVYMCGLGAQARVAPTGGPSGPLYNCSFYTYDIGYFYQGDLTRDFGGVLVPANSVIETQRLPIRLDVFNNFVALFELFENLAKNDDTILCLINGTLVATLDASELAGSSPLQLTLNFTQRAIPLFSNLSAVL